MSRKRPGSYRLLDLFCGGGGASVGYARAGFDVVGVDCREMGCYPYRFVQADAFAYLEQHGHGFDVIHASPPCQAYSRTRAIWNRDYPDLVSQTRQMLMGTGKLYVIENVVEAPLVHGIVLCGTMFGLRVYRHRRFECSVFLRQPEHPPHKVPAVATGRRSDDPGAFYTVAGHVSQVARCRDAMGIPWMPRRELVQAIPPAYTQFIGKQLIAALESV